MDFLKMLISALLNYNDFESRLLPESTGIFTASEDLHSAAPMNLNREMLYEGFISIDSMVFIFETNQLTENALNDFIEKTVLVAKTLLLESPTYFDQFDNYQNKAKNTDKRLRSALELRNKYFNADKSLIAKGLTMERHKALKSRIGKEGLRLYYEDEDRGYLRMMERLMSAKYENDGIYKAIKREVREFYVEKARIPKPLVLDARVSLSLGGAIFIPGLLAAITKELNLPSKQELINNTVSKILAPSEELLSQMHLKSFTEKKALVLGFLQSCLKRKDGPFKDKIDRGFEERTKILEIYLKDDPGIQEKLQTLDRLQEEEINKLIFVFNNIDENDLSLRLDKPVIEAYGELLNYGQKSMEKSLYSFFKQED